MTKKPKILEIDQDTFDKMASVFRDAGSWYHIVIKKAAKKLKKEVKKKIDDRRS